MADGTCIECGGVRRNGQGSAKRQLCITCYNRWYRANRKREKTCEWCKETFQTARAEQRFCGTVCGSTYAWSHTVPKPKKEPKPKCSQEHLQAMWKAQRSPIRAAYEDEDWAALIPAIRDRSVLTDDGCWEWAGPQRDGYPNARIGGRIVAVHRMALEAKHRAPLGSQHAHHVCANSICVNPDHLQPVTHAENIAEMLARTSYEARITELEAALFEVSPTHPALNRVRYGSVA